MSELCCFLSFHSIHSTQYTRCDAIRCDAIYTRAHSHNCRTRIYKHIKYDVVSFCCWIFTSSFVHSMIALNYCVPIRRDFVTRNSCYSIALFHFPLLFNVCSNAISRSRLLYRSISVGVFLLLSLFLSVL